MSKKQIFTRLRDILSQPGAFKPSRGWWEPAADKDGKLLTWAMHPDAVSWSVMGAFNVACDGCSDIHAYDMLREYLGLPRPIKGGWTTDNANDWAYNNHKTQGDVVAMLDVFIETLS